MNDYGYKKIQQEREQPKQPEKCKGCLWGTWTGTKQVCMRLPCVKQKAPAEQQI